MRISECRGGVLLAYAYKNTLGLYEGVGCTVRMA